MAELADALVLGTSAFGMQVQVLLPHHLEYRLNNQTYNIESIEIDSFFFLKSVWNNTKTVI